MLIKVLISANNLTMKSICCRNGLLYHLLSGIIRNKDKPDFLVLKCIIFCNNQTIKERKKVVSISSNSGAHEMDLITQSCVVTIVKPVKVGLLPYRYISVLR